MLSKVQVNIVLSDHNVEATIDTICEAARTGETGDGLIFVYPIQEVIRIRTGERGQEALTYQGDIDERRKAMARTPAKSANGTNGDAKRKAVKA
jgi:nitrogen regulatory protein P-II 1